MRFVETVSRELHELHLAIEEDLDEAIIDVAVVEAENGMLIN